MFYYKNKVKAVVMVVVVVLLLAVAVTVCLWDDTSIKSLKATGGTSNFIGKPPWPPAIELGDRLTIDSIKYTVGYKGTVGTDSFVTLYSDDVSGKGVIKNYDSRGNNYNYDGSDGWLNNPVGIASQIYTSINNYYFTTLAGQTITVDKTVDTYGKVSDYIIPHRDYGWSLWLPSPREVGLPYSDAELQGSVQPVMNYYNTSQRRNYNNTDYWLRSPYTGYTGASALTHAYYVLGGGELHIFNVSVDMGATRVALNLRI